MLGLGALLFPFVIISVLSSAFIDDPKIETALDLLWAWALAYSFTYLFRWSRYDDSDKLSSIAYIFATGTSLLLLLAAYPFAFIRLDFGPEGLQDLSTYLPMIYFKWETVFYMLFSKAAIIALLFLCLLLFLRIAAFKVLLWKYPEEVRDLVFYFKVKRRKNDSFVKTELAKRGWTDPRLQQELLDFAVETEQM